MTFIELFALAVALAMDAFAVAVCTGCSLKRVTLAHFVRLSFAFGFFQFLMPVLGWYLGLTVRGFIESWDHWIAFALLAWIGGNMIRSSLTHDAGSESCDATPNADPTRGRRLLILAIATSIDALAVGLSFALLNLTVWGPATLIGIVCAIITAGGLLAGKMLAKADLFGRWAELAGGCVLIGIGLKILYEHGMF